MELTKWRETEETKKATKAGMEALKKKKEGSQEKKRPDKKNNGASISATKSKRQRRKDNQKIRNEERQKIGSEILAAV